MKTRTYGLPVLSLALAGAYVIASAGCKTSNPAQPSTAASGGGVSIVAPATLSPGGGTTVPFNTLPVKLTVKNAVATNGTPLSYTFEVAYDASFSSKIFTKEAVDQGSNGQTTVTADTLLPSNTYYWRVRAQGGGTTGVFSAPSQFRIGGQVTLGAVTLVAPRDGDFLSAQPTLTVANVSTTGPAGAITYKFEVSDSTGFGTLAASATVAQGSSQTSYTVSPALAVGKTYFWRVTAIDAANGASSTSGLRNFSVISSIASLLAAEEGETLWPGVQPPGTAGHTTYGQNWDVGEKIAVNGDHYLSPQVEALRLMDLMDRGMGPGDAIVWMKQNGYPTIALYYPAPLEVIGIQYQYLAGLDPSTGKPSATGYWNLVDRAE